MALLAWPTIPDAGELGSLRRGVRSTPHCPCAPTCKSWACGCGPVCTTLELTRGTESSSYPNIQRGCGFFVPPLYFRNFVRQVLDSQASLGGWVERNGWGRGEDREKKARRKRPIRPELGVCQVSNRCCSVRKD